jgi:L,D-peptidoglycan transpeptidase YkuD (ErfK/YbiS/YcfS/YnhG family)
MRRRRDSSKTEVKRAGSKLATVHLRSIALRHGRSSYFIQAGIVYFKCDIGENGAHYMKREGDKRTPKGKFKINCAYFRADRIKRPSTLVKIRHLNSADVWSDDATSFTYNRHGKEPAAYRHEKLWVVGHEYDLLLVIEYNTSPRVLERGSAIFMHQKSGSGYTAGCVALEASDLKKLLQRVKANFAILI